MKFSIARQNLDKGIQRVLAVISPKTTLPVLANFLVRADGKKKSITLTATDLDMTVTTEVDAQVEEGGGVTLPPQRFAEIVRELGDTDIELSAEGEEIGISAGRSNFKIVGIPEEEFPSLPKSDPASAFSVDGAALADMVEKVSFCISRDETRPSLNGAYWEFSPDDMSMTATDGHRLATITVRGEFEVPAGKSLIVPPKALGHVVRIIGTEGDGNVKVAVHENHLTFFIGATTA